MKQFWTHAGILMGVFLAATLFFSLITNRNAADQSVDMAAATLPRVKFTVEEDSVVNTLPAYLDEMDLTSMRDTITPAQNDSLKMLLERNGNDISKISYELYSLDGKTLYTKGSAKEANGVVEIPLNGSLPQDEEGVLKVTLLADKQELHYYTRVIASEAVDSIACLSFAQQFHNAALEGNSSAISPYLESNEEGDNSTYQTVNIHSDAKHVLWGELKPSVTADPEWDIKESTASYTSILAHYQVSCSIGEDTVHTYNVREFFQVSQKGDTLYLLDYQRTMNQVFDPSSQVLTESGIDLGIADPDVTYMTNASGTVVSFVQERDLWTYRQDEDELSLVFSFSNTEGNDVRNWYDQHSIRILDVEKNGSTTFAVYGYMNRGDHEGRVGVDIFYFDIRRNALEEKAFIPSNKAFMIAEDELGRMVYYNHSSKQLHVLTGGTLYEIDLSDGTQKKLAAKLKEGQYAVSEDGHLLAYQPTGSLTDANSVIVMNLADSTSNTINCEKGDSIRPLGFIDEDFIYGLAHKTDTGKTISGEELLPMYSLQICNSDNEIIKSFQTDGRYIADITLDSNMATLNLLSKEGSVYISASPDYITCNEPIESSSISLETYTSEACGRQVRIAYEDGISDLNPKVLKPKLTAMKNDLTVSLNTQSTEEKYYVYGMGELTAVYNRASYAIQKAESISGIVISSKQAYIWEKGNRDLVYDTKASAFTNNGLSSLEACRNYMKQFDAEEVDLSGCTVEQILYVINKGLPVIAVLNENQAILLTAYNSGTITYMDPAIGSLTTVSHEAMTELMASSGNTFLGYIK